MGNHSDGRDGDEPSQSTPMAGQKNATVSSSHVTLPLLA